MKRLALLLLVVCLFSYATDNKPKDVGLTHEELYSEIIERGIEFPEVVFAQAILESGNMRSRIFRENNNLFGMKLPDRRESTAFGKSRGHAKYYTWEDSVIDYFLFQEAVFKARQKKGYRKYTMDGYLNYLDRVYSESSNYSKSVKRVMKEFSNVIYKADPNRYDGSLENFNTNDLTSK